MTSGERPRIVIFGAGNIGRSFIAPVFTAGGYEAVFVDVASAILDALSTNNSYTLVEVSDEGEVPRIIGPVRGVDGRDTRAVKRELDGAGICATCVGAVALPMVLRSIAKAAVDRYSTLDIILAENLKGAGDMARQAFIEAGIPDVEARRRLGVIETSIGKMVPSISPEQSGGDVLLCRAEPYNTLIVDADGFTGPIPRIGDLMPVSPIAPWVARKLYIHNFGHAAVAYLGFRAHPEAKYIREVLEDSDIENQVRRAMTVAGEAVAREFAGTFSSLDIENHVDDLLRRFKNRALGDTIYRVGRDLGRKLHRTDRVVGALALVLKHRLDIAAPLEVFRAALCFAAAGPDGQPDEEDKVVLSRAADPEVFLDKVVGVDADAERALAKILMTVLAETGAARS